MNNLKALLKIWYKCNYKCNFCHAEFKKSIISYDLRTFYLKILLLKKKWVKVILLSWGESTLEKHFFEIVSFIKKNNLYFWIVTNWSTIYSDYFLDKLILLWIKNIYLSIHWYWEIHNNIVWDNNGFDKIIKVIQSLKKYNEVDLFLNYVVTKENYLSINDTVDYLNNLWYEGLKIKFSILEPSWLGIDEKLFIDPNISTKIIKQVIKSNYYKNLNIYWDGFPICFFYDLLERRWDLQTENILYITEVFENKIYKTDYWYRWYINECNNCSLKSECYWIHLNYISKYKKDNLINLEYLWKK